MVRRLAEATQKLWESLGTHLCAVPGYIRIACTVFLRTVDGHGLRFGRHADAPEWDNTLDLVWGEGNPWALILPNGGISPVEIVFYDPDDQLSRELVHWVHIVAVSNQKQHRKPGMAITQRSKLGPDGSSVGVGDCMIVVNALKVQKKTLSHP
jgi:hypothetical protein